MQNDYELNDLEDFRINPHVWLRTLLAIAGDREKKAEVIRVIAEKTNLLPDDVEVILSTTISVLLNDTRAN